MISAYYTRTQTPIGALTLLGNEEGLTEIRFGSGERGRAPMPDCRRDDGPFEEAVRELNAYFARSLQVFTIPLAPVGTAFQKAVWTELQRIPWGQTRTYSQVAESIDRPRAVRAVGAANGKNPIPIMIPCHRVIGANGGLTGYAGGVEIKRQLLTHEGVLLPNLGE